jgi:hypothetical protein
MQDDSPEMLRDCQGRTVIDIILAKLEGIDDVMIGELKRPSI